MIDLKELRLNNLVKYNKPEHGEVITAVHGLYWELKYEEWCIVSDSGLVINIGGISPIPITPEWLESHAYNHFVINEDCYGFGAVELRLCNGGWSVDYEGNTLDGVFLRHVHQLQNLYFALTGSELTITEKATT